MSKKSIRDFKPLEAQAREDVPGKIADADNVFEDIEKSAIIKSPVSRLVAIAPYGVPPFVVFVRDDPLSRFVKEGNGDGRGEFDAVVGKCGLQHLRKPPIIQRYGMQIRILYRK